MIHPERVQLLNDKPARDADYVLYWMQASQRAECNHALEYAIRRANDLNQPAVVVVGITDRFPEASERHYAFMLQGLAETQTALHERGIQLVARHQPPTQAAVEMAEAASLLVTDRGYLRIMKRWRARVGREARCQAVQVESDVIVPVETVSPREEYAARTIRPRLHKQLNRYLVPLRETPVERDSLGLAIPGMDLRALDAVLAQLRTDRTARRVDYFVGGTSRAKQLLHDFISQKLDRYHELSNDPGLDWISHMSPYLHFGQISPLYVASRIRERPGPGADAYLEQLVVRRELSANLVHYNPRYDSVECLPEWARATLDAHRADRRETLYSPGQLKRAQTDDPYWNAAQQEMMLTGKMHSHMRMYWGKRLLEWTREPQEAYRLALRLNNKYELDGRDPNSFAGVAWCFGKHDRPWKERPVFGKVRYMNAAGLERKFDMNAYVRKVNNLRSSTRMRPRVAPGRQP